MFYQVNDVNFCGFTNLASVSRQQVWSEKCLRQAECAAEHLLHVRGSLLHTATSAACLSELRGP